MGFFFSLLKQEIVSPFLKVPLVGCLFHVPFSAVNAAMMMNTGLRYLGE
jgi:hypothetical protein